MDLDWENDPEYNLYYLVTLAMHLTLPKPATLCTHLGLTLPCGEPVPLRRVLLQRSADVMNVLRLLSLRHFDNLTMLVLRGGVTQLHLQGGLLYKKDLRRIWKRWNEVWT